MKESKITTISPFVIDEILRKLKSAFGDLRSVSAQCIVYKGLVAKAAQLPTASNPWLPSTLNTP